MTQSFYRKWRPQVFQDLVGQPHIKETLKNSLKQGKISHAYLFSGPRGTGKTTTARLLAKAINCLSPKGPEPCNRCLLCQAISKDALMDVIEIDAASARGIDEIRELREKVKFRPSQAKYKIYIIDEVHMLTKEAFNALLKTLEEPPAHAIFILATTEPHKVPLTIISRCQRFDFKKAGLADIEQLLGTVAKAEKINLESGALRQLAQVADGSFRDGLTFLEQIHSSGITKITPQDLEDILGLAGESAAWQFINFIFEDNTQKAFEVLADLALKGIDFGHFNSRVIVILRQLLLVVAGHEQKVVANLAQEQAELLEKWSQNLSMEIMLALLSRFVKVSSELKFAALPELPLELAVLEVESILPKVKSQATIPSQAEIRGVEDFPWGQVQEKLKPLNHSLYGLLKDITPLRLEENKLVLGAKFKFHREQICAPRQRDILEQVLQEVTGQKYQVACEIIQNDNLVEEAGNIL